MPLSVLDLSPVPTGTRPSQALHETLELARTAEAAGYHRYWLAEHHNIRSVVSTSVVTGIRLRKLLPVDVRTRLLFEYPVLADFAAAIARLPNG